MVQQSAVLDKVTPAQDRLTVREKLGFGFGDAACNMSWGPVTMFLTWFLFRYIWLERRPYRHNVFSGAAARCVY